MGRCLPSPTSERVHRICRGTVSVRVGLLVVAQGSFRNAGPGEGSLSNYRVVFIPDWFSAFFWRMMALVRRDLPSGTVTFLFTDVEGSTRLLHELGAEGYGQALAEHRRVLREAFAAQGGVEVDTQGDAFFVAFPTGPGRSTRRRHGRRFGGRPDPGADRESIPGRHTSPMRGTSVSMSTGRRGSRPPATVARCWSRRRRLRSSVRTACATWASTGSRICRRLSGSTSSATTTSRR